MPASCSPIAPEKVGILPLAEEGPLASAYIPAQFLFGDERRLDFSRVVPKHGSRPPVATVAAEAQQQLVPRAQPPSARNIPTPGALQSFHPEQADFLLSSPDLLERFPETSCKPVMTPRDYPSIFSCVRFYRVVSSCNVRAAIDALLPDSLPPTTTTVAAAFLKLLPIVRAVRSTEQPHNRHLSLASALLASARFPTTCGLILGTQLPENQRGTAVFFRLLSRAPRASARK